MPFLATSPPLVVVVEEHPAVAVVLAPIVAFAAMMPIMGRRRSKVRATPDLQNATH